MINFKSIFYLHPLHATTFLYTLGIYLGYKGLPISLLLLALLFATLSIGIIAKIRQKRLCYVLFALPIALVYGAYNYHNTMNKHHHFYNVIAQKPYTLFARVADIQKNTTIRFPYALYLVDCALYETGATLQPVYKNFCLILYAATQDIAIDDIISLENVIFKKNSSPEFEYYLARQEISSTIFLQAHHQCTKIHHHPWSLRRWIYEKKMNLYHTLETKMSSLTKSFFSSLFLGAKETTWIHKKIKHHFNYWGISHYLARSGLHLVVFILLWKYILRFLPLYFHIKQIFLALLTLLYCILSWPSISFIRALYMYIAYTIYCLCDQQTNSLHILSSVLLFLLVMNPLHLIFLDFQLSFGLTYALLLFVTIYKK